MDQTPMVASVLSALPRLSGLMANVVFGKVKEGMSIVEAMERFGFRNGKTSNEITIIHSVAQGSAPTHLLAISYNLCSP